VPIGIGSNIASLKAQRRLSEGTSALTKSYEQLSSGQRINQASDDEAGLAIATALNSRAKVYGQAVRNANDGLSLYAIADSAVSSLTDINTRLQELASQAANGVYSTTQRQAMDAEAQALSQEYFRISRAAQFNGQRLFDGSMSNGLTLQLGYGTSGTISGSVGGKR
jgi:flagellin